MIFFALSLALAAGPAGGTTPAVRISLFSEWPVEFIVLRGAPRERAVQVRVVRASGPYREWDFSTPGVREVPWLGTEYVAQGVSVFPIRCRLTDLSGRDRKLHLILAVEGPSGKALFERDFSLSAGGKQELTFPYPYPFFGLSGYSARITVYEGEEIVGTKQGALLSLEVEAPSRPGEASNPELLLIAKEVSGSLPKVRSLPLVKGGRRAVGERIGCWTLPPSAVPPHIWYGYLVVPAVAVTESAVSALQPAQLKALWQYVAMGGTLVLLGVEPERIFPEGASGLLDRRGEKEEWYMRSFLLGSVFVVPDSRGAGGRGVSLPAGMKPVLRVAARQSAAYWLNTIVQTQGGEEYFVITEIEKDITARFVKGTGNTFLVVLLCFVVLAGPVNLFLINRLKRPLLLVVTAPVLSLICIVFLLGATLLKTGIVPRVILSTFTILDPRAAIESTWTSFYTQAALPPRVVTLGPEEFFTVQVLPPFFRRETGPVQRVTGILQPLKIQRILSGRVRTTQLCVTVEKRKKEAFLTNGLNVHLKQIFVNMGGRIYGAREVPPGEKVRLEDLGEPAVDFHFARAWGYAGKKYLWDQIVGRSDWVSTKEGGFIAVAAGSPFFKLPFEGDIEEELHVIGGWIRYAP